MSHGRSATARHHGGCQQPSESRTLRRFLGQTAAAGTGARRGGACSPSTRVMHTGWGENGALEPAEWLPPMGLGRGACWGAPRSDVQGEASVARVPPAVRGPVVSSYAAVQGAHAMGKILELSDATYQHLVDLAQQQRAPEEMLRVCLATYRGGPLRAGAAADDCRRVTRRPADGPLSPEVEDF